MSETSASDKKLKNRISKASIDSLNQIPPVRKVKDNLIKTGQEDVLDNKELNDKAEQETLDNKYKESHELEYKELHHDVTFKIDERSIKFVAKGAFILASGSFGSTLVAPLLTGLGYALGGPAFGATCFVVGKAAGCGIGLATGKGIADKFIPLEKESINYDDRGMTVNTKIKSQRLKKR